MTLDDAGGVFARLWSHGNGDERGVAILVHGLGDHGGRHAAFARHLVSDGWAVLAMDLPGHGRSPGRRGIASSYDSLMKMIAAARRQMRARFGPLPQLLIGHSMGGNLAVNYLLRRHEFDGGSLQAPAGMVLMAPMLMPPEKIDRTQIFAAWGTGQLLRRIRISKPARLDQLTRNTKAAEAIENDPLQHSQISLYLATQLLAQGRFALDHASEIRTPTLVVYGQHDELIDQSACRNLAIRIGDEAECVCWPGGRHDLVHDVDHEQVTQHLRQWIGKLHAKPRLLQAA